MTKILTRDTLEEILDGAGLDPEEHVYNWPSGMYDGYGGHHSFALTVTNVELARFYLYLGRVLGETAFGNVSEYPEGTSVLLDLLPSGTDQLGKRTVTYFYGWELEPEDGGE